MSPAIQRFGFLLFPGTEELDLVGPWEMVTMWQQVAGGPKDCLIVAQSMQPVACAKGMSITPHADFDSCPPLDVLLVPGGRGTRTEVDNPVLMDFVRRQAAQARAVLSVCTGSFILHKAGLLDGRRATTYWASLPRLREAGVAVEEVRYVRNDRVWTSAGVSAGIDMTLAFIADVAGAEVAGQVQLGAEYYPDGVRWGTAAAHPQAPAYVRAG
ncbi:MAG: DJ-1/PfpI family protein [Aquabacterium sp.]